MSAGDVCVTSVSVAFCSLQWGLPKKIRGSFSQVTDAGKSRAGTEAPEVLRDQALLVSASLLGSQDQGWTFSHGVPV